jgi:hypothetical protein
VRHEGNVQEVLTKEASGGRGDEVSARVSLYERAQRRVVPQTCAIPVYAVIYNVAAAHVRGIAVDAHGFLTSHDARTAS